MSNIFIETISKMHHQAHLLDTWATRLHTIMRIYHRAVNHRKVFTKDDDPLLVALQSVPDVRPLLLRICDELRHSGSFGSVSGSITGNAVWKKGPRP